MLVVVTWVTLTGAEVEELELPTVDELMDVVPEDEVDEVVGGVGVGVLVEEELVDEDEDVVELLVELVVGLLVELLVELVELDDEVEVELLLLEVLDDVLLLLLDVEDEFDGPFSWYKLSAELPPQYSFEAPLQMRLQVLSDVTVLEAKSVLPQKHWYVYSTPA